MNHHNQHHHHQSTQHDQSNNPPQVLHHFSHHHPLILQRSQIFVCDACFEFTTGDDSLFYICTPCDYGLHVTCASLPRHVWLQSHHADHRLGLVTLPPSQTYDLVFRFVCGVCGLAGPGFAKWWYRCGSCGFDVHLDCATRILRPHTAAATTTTTVPFGFSTDAAFTPPVLPPTTTGGGSAGIEALVQSLSSIGLNSNNGDNTGGGEYSILNGLLGELTNGQGDVSGPFGDFQAVAGEDSLSSVLGQMGDLLGSFGGLFSG